MKRIVALMVCSIVLIGCGAADTMRNGLAHSNAVETKLLGELGHRSHVGFSWANGHLTTVTVTFDGVPQAKDMKDILVAAERAVRQEFVQTPKRVVVAFALSPAKEAH